MSPTYPNSQMPHYRIMDRAEALERFRSGIITYGDSFRENGTRWRVEGIVRSPNHWQVILLGEPEAFDAGDRASTELQRPRAWKDEATLVLAETYIVLDEIEHVMSIHNPNPPDRIDLARGRRAMELVKALVAPPQEEPK